MDKHGFMDDFSLNDLRTSGNPKDEVLREKMVRIMDLAMGELKPMLCHATKSVLSTIKGSHGRLNPQFGFLVLQLTEVSNENDVRIFLFIDEEGDFFTARECSERVGEHYHRVHGKGAAESVTWGRAPFCKLIWALRNAFAEAKKKYAEDQKTRASRMALLDKMMDEPFGQ